jgi:hypothetical protein
MPLLVGEFSSALGTHKQDQPIEAIEQPGRGAEVKNTIQKVRIQPLER